jgi:predicted negative regulator of RcsB-dependent stress response
VKGLLRAAQARIGLGPGEFSSAAAHLQQALQQAQEQQLPTRGELRFAAQCEQSAA